MCNVPFGTEKENGDVVSVAYIFNVAQHDVGIPGIADLQVYFLHAYITAI